MLFRFFENKNGMNYSPVFNALLGSVDEAACALLGRSIAFVLSIALGAVASHAFRAHHVLAALYHGATAPLALAFIAGIDTHGPR
jgi:hypothetical protein